MYSTRGHENYQWGDVNSEVLANAQFIHMPKQRFQYLGIDLDWEGSASLWMDEGFPEPTITIITPTSNHSKFFYELEHPVTIPRYWGSQHINFKPYLYFKDVKLGLTLAMEGDLSYSGTSMNNPFYRNLEQNTIKTENGEVSSKWKVHWADKRYALEYLAEFAVFPTRKRYQTSFEDSDSREVTLFNSTRAYAYEYVHQFDEYNSFHEAVASNALENWLKLSQIEKDHPLMEKEAHAVAKAVSRWVWMRRKDRWMKRFTWDIGALGFEALDKSTLSEEELKFEIHNRKSMGARYANEKRRRNTESKIHSACEELVRNNQKVTRKNISEMTQLSLKTLNNYKETIKHFKHKSIQTQ
ncbi:hypothetical protein JCM15519_22770 [Fundidesulfovibrio butyratiphilus]